MVGCLYSCRNTEGRRNWNGGDYNVGKGDTLILQLMCHMRKQDIEKEKQWFKDETGINVVIVDERYEIKGVEEDGERVC